MKLAAFRMLSLLAIGLCTTAVLESVRPAFCSDGCTHIAGHPAGPMLGLIAFAGLFGLTLFAERTSRFLGSAAILAGCTGLGLTLLQIAVLRRICSLCLLIDATAMLIAAVELGFGGLPIYRCTRLSRWLWTAAVLPCAGAPLLWGALQGDPEVPPVVKAHWHPGKINLVAITDERCAACRETEPALKKMLDERRSQLALTRLRSNAIPNSQLPALPTILVQDERLVGVQTVDSLQAAIERAVRKR